MKIGPVVSLALAMSLWSASAVAQGTVRSSAPRPPLLEASAACEVWDGKASGNDPSVEVSLELCPRDDEVTGVVQWSSTTSGWNRRAVAGRDDGAGLQLRDTRIIEEKPAPGWRFCVIDSYELRRTSPDVLEGTYRSEACKDQATVSLKRRAESTAGDSSTASTAASGGSSERKAPPSATSTPPASNGSRCSVSPGGPGPASLLAPLSLVAAALLARSRRDRIRRPGSRSR